MKIYTHTHIHTHTHTHTYIYIYESFIYGNIFIFIITTFNISKHLNNFIEDTWENRKNSLKIAILIL